MKLDEANQAFKPCTSEICPVETALNIIGGKWKGVLIFHLLGGKKRFNQLKKLLPSITHRVLTLQLRELERDGIVNRTIFAEVPPRVEYELTEFGKSISPVIDAIFDWGKEYQENLRK